LDLIRAELPVKRGWLLDLGKAFTSRKPREKLLDPAGRLQVRDGKPLVAEAAELQLKDIAERQLGNLWTRLDRADDFLNSRR